MLFQNDNSLSPRAVAHRKDTRRPRRARCQRPSAFPLQPPERSRGSAATIAPERPHCRQSVGAVQQRRQSHLLSAFLAPAFDIYCWQLNCVGILGQRRVCFGKAHHPGRPVAAHRRHEFVATRRLLTVTLLLINRRHSEPDTHLCLLHNGYPLSRLPRNLNDMAENGPANEAEALQATHYRDTSSQIGVQIPCQIYGSNTSLRAY